MTDREKEIYLLMLGWKKYTRRVRFDGYISSWKIVWSFDDEASSADHEEFSLDKAYDIAIR